MDHSLEFITIVPCLLQIVLNERSKIFLMKGLFVLLLPRGSHCGEFGELPVTGHIMVAVMISFFYRNHPLYGWLFCFTMGHKVSWVPAATDAQLLIISWHVDYKTCSLPIQSHAVLISNHSFYGMPETIIMNLCLLLVFFLTLEMRSSGQFPGI